ncbi:hypothetical protein ACFQ1M_16185 [Sungkyunkwania multivorans]|uniref:Glycerophosphoryl diester phosphodiesterase membrane domain-containing protein n=1 Tax=Sungkyunkwania multivorans TaxID=1173618 RepID=A0ABW3D1N7_9FLAO
MNSETLESKIDVAPKLDFGHIFSESIELFKKVWLQGVLLLIFSIILLIPIFIIVYAPLLAFVYAQESGTIDFENDAFASGTLSIGLVILVLALIIVVSVVQTGLIAGFYRICKDIDHGKEVNSGHFFTFLKKEYFGKILGLSLLTLLISIVAMALCLIPFIYAFVPLSFIVPIFAFNPQFRISEIVTLAFRLGNKFWLVAFGLLFIIGVGVGLISQITCGLGGIFLGCFGYLPTYVIYKQVCGFEDESEIDQIGESF